MQISSLSTSKALWGFILVGILTSVLIPIFLMLNLYSINQNTNLLFKETLQDTSVNQVKQFIAGENYQDISKKLNSDSNAIMYSVIFTPNLSYLPVLSNEIFAWKLETKRLISNLQGGLFLIETSLKLFDSISDVNKTYTSSIETTYIESPEKSEFESIKSLLSQSMADMNRYKKLSEKHRPLFSPTQYLDKRLDLKTNENRIFNTSSVIHLLTDIVYEYTKIVELSHPFNILLSDSSKTSNLISSDLSKSLNTISEDSYLLK